MARPLFLVLPLLLPAAPALALTPEELWSAWQAQAQGFGVTLDAEAVPGGDGSVTLRNWTRQIGAGPVEPLPAEAPVQQVILRPVEAGAVEIDFGLPPRLDLPGGAGTMGDLRIEQEGLRIVARDGTDGIDYEVTAASIRTVTLAVDQNPAAGDFAAETANLRIAFPGQIGPDRTVDLALSMDGLAYVANIVDPFRGMGNTATRMEGTVSLEVGATLPEGVGLEAMDTTADFLRALEAGLALRVGLGIGAGSQSSRNQDSFGTYRYDGTFEAGEASVTLDVAGVALAASMGGGAATVVSTDLPLPSLDVTYGPLLAELRLPFGAEPGDFRYALSFEEVTLPPAAWDMVDPSALLPREPLGFRLDLGGRVALDLAAQAEAEAAGMDSPPPVVESVELRELAVAGLGARVSASGALTFAPPAPEPTGGGGTVRIEGLNVLLDAAVALGWATPEDLLPVRAGVGAFFRETSPDVREAVIEVREGGAVFANGMPLQ